MLTGAASRLLKQEDNTNELFEDQMEWGNAEYQKMKHGLDTFFCLIQVTLNVLHLYRQNMNLLDEDRKICNVE